MATGYLLSAEALKQVQEVVRRVLREGANTARTPQRHWHSHTLSDSIEFVILGDDDGTDAIIDTGVAGYLEIPFQCGIVAARMVADTSTTSTVDIWKDTYANFPPTNADSITASAPLSIAAGTKDEDTTLTGWTTAINAGDWLAFNVDANDNATRLVVSLTVRR